MPVSKQRKYTKVRHSKTHRNKWGQLTSDLNRYGVKRLSRRLVKPLRGVNSK